MARYVILEHDHPFLHWDLMLEAGEVLYTWRLMRAPEDGFAVPAEKSFDHRRKYLDYEGPIDGDRGSVHCWERGEFTGAPPGELKVGEKRTISVCRESGLGKLCFHRTSAASWIITFFSDKNRNVRIVREAEDFAIAESGKEPGLRKI